MNYTQYEKLRKIAEGRVRVAETEQELMTWLEGVTDTLYVTRDYETMTQIENRVAIMWEQKRLEGMM